MLAHVMLAASDPITKGDVGMFALIAIGGLAAMAACLALIKWSLGSGR